MEGQLLYKSWNFRRTSDFVHVSKEMVSKRLVSVFPRALRNFVQYPHHLFRRVWVDLVQTPRVCVCACVFETSKSTSDQYEGGVGRDPGSGRRPICRSYWEEPSILGFFLALSFKEDRVYFLVVILILVLEVANLLPSEGLPSEVG